MENYLQIEKEMKKLNIMKSIGYDGNRVETFLFFQNYFHEHQGNEIVIT